MNMLAADIWRPAGRAHSPGRGKLHPCHASLFIGDSAAGSPSAVTPADAAHLLLLLTLSCAVFSPSAQLPLTVCWTLHLKLICGNNLRPRMILSFAQVDFICCAIRGCDHLNRALEWENVGRPDGLLPECSLLLTCSSCAHSQEG